MADARFEDVSFADQPLRLGIESTEDLSVASALLQDAVGRAGDVTWMSRRRRLVLLLNRFRWEDRDAASRERRAFERVRTALVLDNVMKVQVRGLDPARKDDVFALLSIQFELGDEPSGLLRLTGAGDAEIALEVECLDGQLMDLTRPWEAASGRPPEHGADPGPNDSVGGDPDAG